MKVADYQSVKCHLCAEHAGHRADGGYHSAVWGGADADAAGLDIGRRACIDSFMHWRIGHELLLLCSAGCHLRHVILSHRQCVQSADHPGEPAGMGQALG